MTSQTTFPGAQLERSPRLREIRSLRDELNALANEMQQVQTNGATLLERVGSQAEASACNLLHYLALRRHDLRELQSRLWICEAAHVPVIWATQVLESLAKEGFPSRAEITDAAMSERAECVMLNKGPHICAAVAVLDDILQRMQTHVTKKRSTFRSLRLADRFFSKDGEALERQHGK